MRSSIGDNMALWQGRSKKKNTGGRYRHFRSKRKFEIAPETQFTVIREEANMKIYRTRGNNSKGRLMKIERLQKIRSVTWFGFSGNAVRMKYVPDTKVRAISVNGLLQ